MSKRVLKRAAEVGEEAHEALIKESEEAVVAAKKDEELFIIDREGDKSKRRRVGRGDEKGAEAETNVSKHERKHVAKYAKQLADKGRNNKAAAKKRVGDGKGKLYDAWGAPEVSDEAAAASGVKKAKGIRASLKLPAGPKSMATPKPGQSYNPAFDDHQDTMAEAVALEIKRNAIVAEASGPLFPKMSAETRAVLLPESYGTSDESSDDEGAGEGEGGRLTASNGRVTAKLTRTERNKQARRRAAEAEERKKAKLKVQRVELNSVSALRKQLNAEERGQQQRRDTRKALRANKEALPPKSSEVLAAPSIPVGLLSEGEVTGELRTIKAIGAGKLLQEQIGRLAQAGLHPDKQRAKVQGAKSRPAPLWRRKKTFDILKD